MFTKVLVRIMPVAATIGYIAAMVFLAIALVMSPDVEKDLITASFSCLLLSTILIVGALSLKD
tara:strand:- start:31199 stop:31387 length:189 start_codon:yes stop_codon:yes gene_type:complete